MKSRKKGSLYILMLLVILSACNKATEKPAEKNWQDQYGVIQNGTVTQESEKPSVTKKPTDIDTSSIEFPYPTPLPVREFVPKEGQVELILWMFGAHEDYLDDHMVAELNHLLQERGCSFFLSKRVEPEENRIDQISLWQESLDAGETVDLLYLGDEDSGLAYKKYGNTAVIRAITGGYLLPFSEYPDTEAKERLLTAYPEEYWSLCRFKGEIYGVSNSLSDFVKQKDYLILNLEAAELAGIEPPKVLDVFNLDELLRKAEKAGIPGIEWAHELSYCGITNLASGLYVKYLPEGTYRIINPLEDESLLSLWDALYRYKENGWQGNSYVTGEFPLIMHKWGSNENWDGNRFCIRSERGEVSAPVKIYEEQERFWVEGQYNQMLGIYSGSMHKEEALELLSLMHGDEEIVQLLRYGIEGVHYRVGESETEDVVTSVLKVYENFFSIGEKTWSSPGKKSFGNRLMYVGLEEQLGRENMEEEWYAGMADIGLIPYLEEFSEEQKKVQEKIRGITYVVGNYRNGISDIATYLILLNEDYKSQIEELRSAFSEAGYNELMKEVNEANGLE